LHHHAEAVEVVALVRLLSVAVGAAAWSTAVNPTAAAQDPLRTYLRPARVVFRAAMIIRLAEPVGAPLPNVAVHVVKAPSIRLIGADRRGATQVGPAPGVIGIAAIEIGNARGERIAKVERCRRAGSAGVFPLGFRRQAIPTPCGFLR